MRQHVRVVSRGNERPVVISRRRPSQRGRDTLSRRRDDKVLRRERDRRRVAQRQRQIADDLAAGAGRLLYGQALLRRRDARQLDEHRVDGLQRVGVRDAHRKHQQAQHPKLTLTGLYNVLDKLRSGEPLSPKEQTIHQQGLGSVLRQLHDELDQEVAAAYGWPADLPEPEILQRLVELNAQRAIEESEGRNRWLRPEFQAPVAEVAQLPASDGELSLLKPAAKSTKLPWPKPLPEQMQAVRARLAEADTPQSPEQIARRFTRARSDRVAELLQTLTALGQCRESKPGRFTST